MGNFHSRGKVGVPQGSLLILMHFNLFITYLELGVNCEVAKSTGETKQQIVNGIPQDRVNGLPDGKCGSLSIYVK